jgi:hypothetical protein
LYGLYLFGFVFLVILLQLVFEYNPLEVSLKDKAPLLGALGIILSAFIASLSVKLNIENTNSIEASKQSKEKKEIHYYIDTELFKFLLFLRPLVETSRGANNKHKHFEDIYSEYGNAYQEIYRKDVLPKASIEVQREINEVFDVTIQMEAGYKHKNFSQNEELYDRLVQIFNELKNKKHILQSKNRTFDDLMAKNDTNDKIVENIEARQLY